MSSQSESFSGKIHIFWNKKQRSISKKVTQLERRTVRQTTNKNDNREYSGLWYEL